MDAADREALNRALSHYAGRIAEVQAEALAARILCGIMLDWLVPKDDDPRQLLADMEDAVHRAFDSMPFTDTEKGVEGYPSLAEKTREFGREYALQSLQSVFRRHVSE